MSSWDEQKNELLTHNLFYAVMNGYNGPGLVDMGYRLVGENVEVPDERRDVTIYPDYVLYDGETVLFVKVVHGESISEETTAEIDSWPRIALEGVKEYLKRAPVRKMNMEPSNAEQYDFCVVVRDDLFSKLSSDSEDLSDIFDAHCVLSVSPGGEAELVLPPLRDRTVSNKLERGIDLPKRPPHNRSLTPDAEYESLAVAIAEEIAITSLKSEEGESIRSEISVSDIRNHFGEDIERAKVREVAKYLENHGACKINEEGNMVFTKSSITPLLDIESRVSETGVREHLHGNTDQANLGAYSED